MSWGNSRGGSMGSGGGNRGPRRSSLKARQRREWNAKHYAESVQEKLTDWDEFYGPVDEPLEGFESIFDALADRR